MRLSKLPKLNPSAIDKCAKVFVPPLVNCARLLTKHLHSFIFQLCGAFIAAFTSEKRWMTINKSLFLNWQFVLNFFIAHLPILVQCKTKHEVGALCALLRKWQLHVGAKLPIAVRDDTVTLKGFHNMGDK